VGFLPESLLQPQEPDSPRAGNLFILLFTTLDSISHGGRFSVLSRIKVECLSVKYREKSVLDGVYFELLKGEITALEGRNGSGKSTLIKAMLGLLPASRESLFFENQYLGKNERVQFAAYLPQHTFLPGRVKVKKLLKLFLPGNSRETLGGEERIAGLLDRKPVTLSGGERRYLEFFMVASLDRDAFFFDEPFSGIEPLYLEAVKNKVLDLKREGKYILISDHDYHSIGDIADRLWLSRQGKVEPAVSSDLYLKDKGYLPASGHKK